MFQIFPHFHRGRYKNNGRDLRVIMPYEFKLQLSTAEATRNTAYSDWSRVLKVQ